MWNFHEVWSFHHNSYYFFHLVLLLNNVSGQENQNQQHHPRTSSPIKFTDQTSQHSTHLTVPNRTPSNSRTAKKHHNYSDNNNWPLVYHHHQDSSSRKARSISLASSRTSGLAFYSDDQFSDNDSNEHVPVFVDGSVDHCTPRNVQIKQSLLIPMLRKENSFKRADQY